MNLYPDLTKRILRTSATNPAQVTKLVATRQDLLALLVQPVEPNPAGGMTGSNQLQVVDVTPYTLQAFVGDYGTPWADQETFTKDEAENTFKGSINLDTDLVEAEFATDPTKVDAYLQLRFLDGADPISIVVPIEIKNQIYSTVAPAPAEYAVPSVFLDALMTLLADTYSVARTLVGSTIEIALRRKTAGGLVEDSGGVSVGTARLLTTVTYGASVAIDMAGNPRQKIVCTGDIELSTANRPSAGQYKEVEVLLVASGSAVDLTVAAGVEFIGVAQAQILDGDSALVRIACWGTAEADTRMEFLKQV